MTTGDNPDSRDAAGQPGGVADDQEEPRVVVRDRRKVDPETGQARPEPQDQPDEAGAETTRAESGRQSSDGQAAEQPSGEQSGAEAVGSDVAKQLEERTADLQRVQAEFANYRRRVERDREASATNAKAGLVGELLTVLDDIERAEQHGDLTGAFKSVADKFVQVLRQAGLESFGSENEPFDPTVHEAVQHDTSPQVSEPTVTAVLRRGYKFGEKVIRNAMVAVTDYEPASDTSADAQAGSGAETAAAEAGSAGDQATTREQQ